LSEAAHEEKVRVAGMVSSIRPHQTKTGKMMAWVMLEDLTGTIELVVFPRTWEKYQFALEVGGVIIAEGKVDAQANPSKVLVDNIRTEIKLTEPAQGAQMHLQPQDQSISSDRKPVTGRISEPAVTNKKAPVARPASGPTPTRSAEIVEDDFDGPPPPEDPPDWDSYTPAATQFATPDLVVHAAELPEEQPLVVEVQPATGAHPLIDGQTSTIDLPTGIDPVVTPVILPVPKVPTDINFSALNDDHAPQMLTVILRPTGDPNRDIRRISRLHGTFISFAGKDRFAFQIFEEGRGHLIEFPNDTTHLCAELLNKIKDAVGEENLRVEPILYQ
jgi:DNA polymerase-3 subunit alpha